MKTHAQGALKVDGVEQTISVHRYRDDERRYWSEVMIETVGAVYSYRVQVGVRDDYGVWFRGADEVRTPVDALPKRTRDAMYALARGMAGAILVEFD